MRHLFFFCFQLFFLLASPASLATSLILSFAHLGSIPQIPVVCQSADTAEILTI